MYQACTMLAASTHWLEGPWLERAGTVGGGVGRGCLEGVAAQVESRSRKGSSLMKAHPQPGQLCVYSVFLANAMIQYSYSFQLSGRKCLLGSQFQVKFHHWGQQTCQGRDLKQLVHSQKQKEMNACVFTNARPLSILSF